MTRNAPLTDEVFARTARTFADAKRAQHDERERRKREGEAAYADLHGLPTPERTRKGDVIQTTVRGTGKRTQAMDALDHLLARGRITEASWRAGKDFQEDFVKAGLEAVKAIDWQRAQGRPLGDAGAVARAHASNRVWRVFETFGGVDSPAGKLIWHVIGAGESLSDFANRTGENPTGSSGALIVILLVIENVYA